MSKKEICLKRLIKGIVKEELNRYRLEQLVSSKTNEELDEQYLSYKITHSFCGFGSYLFESEEGKFAKTNNGYSVPLDKVKQELITKYGLKDWQIKIHKSYGNVEIAILIADIGSNTQLIERDMKQMGYFVGNKTQITADNGTVWKQIQFEPFYQKELEIFKKKRLMLFHISPLNNLESIRQKGFVPSSKNEFLSYTDRVYFYAGKSDLKDFLDMVDFRYISNGWGDEKYCIFLLDTSKIPNNVKFFADPNMENGIYTYDNVPYSAVFQEIVIDLHSGKIISNNKIN